MWIHQTVHFTSLVKIFVNTWPHYMVIVINIVAVIHDIFSNCNNKTYKKKSKCYTELHTIPQWTRICGLDQITKRPFVALFNEYLCWRPKYNCTSHTPRGSTHFWTWISDLKCNCQSICWTGFLVAKK